MVDFKHMHRSNRIEPVVESWRDGWECSKAIDIIAAWILTGAMVAAIFYGLSEAVIRGWIG